MNTFNQNNQHGDNIMNIGSQPRELNIELQNQIKEVIKIDSVVNVTSVLGDGEAYNFANQIKSYLKEQGYEVNGVNQSVFSNPISGQIIEPPKDNNNTYRIIIGNKE